MEWVTYLGFIAATLTTISLLPQLIKTWKMKETRDISLHMFLIFSIGIFLWLVYGILLKNKPIIFANSITLIFALIMLFFKLKYK